MKKSCVIILVNKTMFDKLLEILEFNETAIMALERLNIADVQPVIAVMKENRRKIEKLQEEAEKQNACINRDSNQRQ